MTEYDYRCPQCGGNDIFFLELRIREEKVVFWCYPCRIKFEAEDQGAKNGLYLQNEILSLSERYPLKERRKAS